MDIERWRDIETFVTLKIISFNFPGFIQHHSKCEETRKLQELDEQYERRSRSNMRLAREDNVVVES